MSSINCFKNQPQRLKIMYSIVLLIMCFSPPSKPCTWWLHVEFQPPSPITGTWCKSEHQHYHFAFCIMHVLCHLSPALLSCMHLNQNHAHDGNMLSLSHYHPPQAHDAKMSISIITLHIMQMWASALPLCILHPCSQRSCIMIVTSTILLLLVLVLLLLLLLLLLLVLLLLLEYFQQFF
jgi:hypothetical protein